LFSPGDEDLKIRKLLGISVIVLLALSGVSSAQADFKGFYFGGYVGGANENSDAKTSTVFSPTGYFATTSVPAIATAGAQSLSPSGFSGGGQAGYNFQVRHFVVGLETDIGSVSMSDSKSTTATYPCCAPTNFTVKQTVETNWMFTLRPRVGFVTGPLLVYGTGGMAVANLNYQALFTDTFATAHENGGAEENQVGWTGGGGAEFKVGPHWSVKGEYLYADLGSVSTTSTNLTAFTPAIPFPTNVFTHTADLRGHNYRFGFNIHF